MKKNYTNLSFFLFFALFSIFFQSCKTEKEEDSSTSNELKSGIWRGVITISGNKELPFNFEISEKDTVKKVLIINGNERLEMDEIVQKGDSIWMKMLIFDSEIKAIINGNEMTGIWVKNAFKNMMQNGVPSPYELPFKAKFDEKRRFLDETNTEKLDISGTWSVNFMNENGETNKAVGIFQQNNNKLTGTFLTTTGDYRYLEGVINNKQLKLSCFDGEHAYLFEGNIQDNNTISQGDFWSGRSGHEIWEAKKDSLATLPSAETLTFLKQGFDKLSFSFPDLNGEKISLDAPQFKDKVVIVQLFGSWCPNCMDETKFLAPFYQKNKDRGLEIIGLAYERSPEFEKAKQQVERIRQRFGVEYTTLIAGTNNKLDASKTLPMLNQVLAFPTTIFIDKKGVVRKIHTGFSGPGTGKYYEEFVEDFNNFVDKLLIEK
jgi:thiol-disulfide isomerase/thioredoxin